MKEIKLFLVLVSMCFFAMVSTNVFADTYAKRIVVAESGGDYTDPAVAMADYTNWDPAPSVDNPYLVKIMPGVYDIGASTVTMRSFVDIEGSGRNATVIKYSPLPSGLYSTVLVRGADNSSIRMLTLEASNKRMRNVAIENPDDSNSSVQDVSIFVYGECWSTSMCPSNSHVEESFGIWNLGGYVNLFNVDINIIGVDDHEYSAKGIYNTGDGNVKMTHVSIDISGNQAFARGVDNNQANSFAELKDSTVSVIGSVSYGINSAGSSNGFTAENSKIYGAYGSIYDYSGKSRIAYSQIDGTIYGSGFKCIGNYNNNLSSLTCP